MDEWIGIGMALPMWKKNVRNKFEDGLRTRQMGGRRHERKPTLRRWICKKKRFEIYAVATFHHNFCCDSRFGRDCL
jgi:hypothetical protein